MADDDQQDQQEESSATGDEKKPDEMSAAIAAATKKANKEAETLRLKLKAFEDRDKTETQRLTEERDALKAERDAVRVDALRARVALAKGLPADLADRLRGADEDSMVEDADRLLVLLKPGKPSGDIDQGVRGEASDEDEKPSMNTLIRSAAGRG